MTVFLLVGYANTGTPSYADFNMVKLDKWCGQNYFERVYLHVQI